MKYALLFLAVVIACEPQTTPVNHAVCKSDPLLANAGWEVLQDIESLSGALFSVSGTSPSDVWAVGATAKGFADFGPLVLHYDGKAWKRFKSGAKGELWWVTPGKAAGTWWMAGSLGQVVRRNPDATFTVMAMPKDTQLFGIWAVSDSDVYAVGGVGTCGNNGGLCGVIWHYDGNQWAAASGMSDAQRNASSWFKVWGHGGELWVVGSEGKILHQSGGQWQEQASGVTDQIFTVSGNASLRVAVGGLTTGVLIEDSGSGWQVAKITGNPKALRGVSVPADGRAVAVGVNGEVWRRCDGTWIRDAAGELEALDDFHAAWKDAGGDVYAVGGSIVAPPFDGGQLAHYGVKTGAKGIGQ